MEITGPIPRQCYSYHLELKDSPPKAIRQGACCCGPIFVVCAAEVFFVEQKALLYLQMVSAPKNAVMALRVIIKSFDIVQFESSKVRFTDFYTMTGKALYTTKEIADLFNIHTNTVRFYEQMEYLSAVERKKNGYRVFTNRHINQISIIKLIYLKEWPGKHLRYESVKIIKALPEWNIPYLQELTSAYILSVKSEIKKVRQAMNAVREMPENKMYSDEKLSFSNAAKEIGVTKDTLRNWERNGFFLSLRDSRNRKYVDQELFEKLKLIYCLRLAGLSMSFIQIYLKYPKKNNTIEVYSAGDHLLEFLDKTLECAEKIPDFLK